MAVESGIGATRAKVAMIAVIAATFEESIESCTFELSKGHGS